MSFRTLLVASVVTVAPCVMALPGSSAMAQWSGPSDTKQAAQPAYGKTTVSAIKAQPKDDQKVTLEGTIVRKTGKERYQFTDGTGEISVEIDDEDFPNEPVGPTTRIRIEGEVDTHLMKEPDIDAERVIVLK